MTAHLDLEARQSRYAALDLVSTPVWIYDIDQGGMHWANTAALHLWRADSLAELCSRDLAADMSAAVAKRLLQHQADFAAVDATFTEQWTLYPAGQPVSLTVQLRGYPLEDGRMAMLCEAAGLVGAQPESLRAVEALLHTGVMITLYSPDGAPLYRNPAARDSVRDQGQSLQDRFVDPEAGSALLDLLGSHGLIKDTYEVTTVAGPAWHELSARRCRDAVTGQEAILVSELDVSAIKHSEAHVQFLAWHDSLTGLPNRSLVMQRFDDMAAGLRSAGQEAALMFMDLDHFKDVNDTLGHDAGDALLVEIARRLRAAVRGDDFVARLSGDEFLIVMYGHDIRGEIEKVRDRLMRIVAAPMQLGAQEVRITPSVGVTLFPDDGDCFEALLRNADLAMYSAKERGRNVMAYYDSAMSEAVRNRTALEADIRMALERNEFEVFYQPIIDVVTGGIVGAEALARWRNPKRGLVTPDVFIPVCESTSLIQPLGAYIFTTAAHQQAEWARAGFDLEIAVNLSARQLRHGDLLQDLCRALADAGCDPGRMHVEITESMLLGSDDALLTLLQGIQALGMSIALDDFGTGYSNLAYLQRFPITTLKIDKSFVQGIDANRPLAEMIVAMCRLMKLSVIAEGVETAEQLAWVRAHGIEQCQGFFFAPPLPATEFFALLDAQRPARRHN